MYKVYIRNFKAPQGHPDAGEIISKEELMCEFPCRETSEKNVSNPKVKTEMGKAGTFEFELEQDNPWYPSLMQLKTMLRVDYDGTTIFYGRVLSIDTDMWGKRKVHCEGALAFLIDTMMEATKEKEREKISIEKYVKNLIDTHNNLSADEPDKHFEYGEIPGEYSDDITPDMKPETARTDSKIKLDWKKGFYSRETGSYSADSDDYYCTDGNSKEKLTANILSTAGGLVGWDSRYVRSYLTLYSGNTFVGSRYNNRWYDASGYQVESISFTTFRIVAHIEDYPNRYRIKVYPEEEKRQYGTASWTTVMNCLEDLTSKYGGYWRVRYARYKDQIGQYGKGNIDLNNRIVVRNEDRTFSTEKPYVYKELVNKKNVFVLIPKIINGEVKTEEQAVSNYQQTGQYLGKFQTAAEAAAYSIRLHERQQWYYSGQPEKNALYLDWLRNYFSSEVLNQPLKITENIININNTIDVNGIFTVLIPEGSKNGESLYLDDIPKTIVKKPVKPNPDEKPHYGPGYGQGEAFD